MYKTFLFEIIFKKIFILSIRIKINFQIVYRFQQSPSTRLGNSIHASHHPKHTQEEDEDKQD